MALNQVGLERLNTATTKKIGTNKNLIINGAMQVAQRGTSSTTLGYVTVDRFLTGGNSLDENPTFEQADLTSSDTPYSSGFRKSAKLTNGNQTSGAEAADVLKFNQKIEAQDLATSGWNYTSASSFITLSFWVRSSVAQTFFVRLQTIDGTDQNFPFSYAVSANTWTKVTKAIPGNSNIQIDINNGIGLDIEWTQFRGTNTTDSGVTLDAWAAYSAGTRLPDNTSTWFTTNNATWEITGVQLEVGSVATDFEHRSFGQELTLCQRYFQAYPHDDPTTAEGLRLNGDYSSVFQTPMRAVPTGVVFGTGGIAGSNSGKYDKDAVGNQNAAIETKGSGFEIDTDGGVGLAAVTLSAEL